MGCSGSKDQASSPAAKPAAKPSAKPADAAAAKAEAAPAADAAAADSVITLTYFNGKGRAELIRLLLTLNKREFVDKRITFEDWAELKPKTPLGTLPVVEMNGKMFAQSTAIARFWAREFSLTGCNAAEAALVDDVVDYIGDIFTIVIALGTATEDNRATLTAECIEKSTPMMERLDTYVSKSTSGFVVGDSLTWGDYSLFLFNETFAQLVGQENLDKHANLTAHFKKVMDCPGVSDYIAARPANDF